jgi:DNA polymerase-3 subunit epsilon
MPNLSAPAIHTGLERIIVLDTETTGVQPFDKIITLAALCFEGDRIQQRSLYLIFDPRKDSHPEAEKIHGWDNWTTRFQDLFYAHAASIREWMQWGDKLVMHNAEFDMRYVQRELRKADHPPLDHPTHCTMQEARRHWAGQRSGLDDCAERIGMRRRPGKHSALEDVFLTAAVYMHLRGKKFAVPQVDVWPMPRNFKPADPRPMGEMPRRTAKRRGVVD